ncbi:glycosyltransferase [Sterolibacterium denitrificans]|nr:glycosyltransferase [Sterolibacterium denitrificans]
MLLLSWGSHGDVLPFVALAQALREAGHEVALGAQPHHAELVRRHGIAFHPLGSQTTPAEYQRLMTTLIDEANPRKQLHHLLQEMLLPDLDAQYRDALALMPAANLVVAHWLQLAGMAAAETLGKPCLTVNLNPQGIMAIAPQRPDIAAQGRTRNLGRELADGLWGEGFHEFRARHGLPPIVSVAEYAQRRAAGLLAVSPALLTNDEIAACNSQPNHRITGFWQPPAERDWQPPAELAQFLAAPEPPVVFCFGSMAGRVEELNAIVLQTVRRLDCRAILQGGWAGLGGELAATSGNILCIDHAPHSYLFPRVACVVHHGGAGTTAAALRAGTPSVIVWHMLDQPYWGNRLAQLELGPAPLPRRELQADPLAERIRLAMNDPIYKENCRRMAQRLGSEQGVGQAVGAIAQLLTPITDVV